MTVDIHVFDRHYRPGRQENLPARIYQPLTPGPVSGPIPGIISVHGGAWSGGDHTTNAYIDTALAQSGFLVFSIACRIAPAHVYPAQVQDVNFAVRWLKTHAEAFNVDPCRIGGLGISSGGHSLFLSAMRPHDPRYTALPLDTGKSPHDARLSYLIGAWPVLDPLARYRFALANKIKFLTDCTQGYFPDSGAMAEGNPQMVLELNPKDTNPKDSSPKEFLDLPPILLVQGTADENLPQGSATRFSRSYRAAGGEAQTAIFKDMPHSFALKPGAESDRALEQMISFAWNPSITWNNLPE